MVTFITSVVAWVTAHYAQMISAYLALVGFVSIIVKMTPTLKDDDVLKGIIKFMGKYIALNRGSTK